MKSKKSFKHKSKLDHKKSKKLFSKTADGVHKKNLIKVQMRGGYRL